MPPSSLVSSTIQDGVAIVRLLGPEGSFPWGTRIFEHRLNPQLLQELNEALDAAERDGAQSLVVIGEGRFFSNGMDLQYISSHIGEAADLQRKAEETLARILTLGVPTVAALNGHLTAAGAMLALAFDVRVMARDSQGLFFVPGVDIGLIYSRGMTELLKAKLPQHMWNPAICFAQRYQCQELLLHGVVNIAPDTGDDLLDRAMDEARELRSKGKDEKQRATLHGIKRNLYREAAWSLGAHAEDMGFASGTWDASGRAAKL